jgi:hypothetical protein
MLLPSSGMLVRLPTRHLFSERLHSQLLLSTVTPSHRPRVSQTQHIQVFADRFKIVVDFVAKANCPSLGTAVIANCLPSQAEVSL